MLSEPVLQSNPIRMRPPVEEVPAAAKKARLENILGAPGISPDVAMGSPDVALGSPELAVATASPETGSPPPHDCQSPSNECQSPSIECPSPPIECPCPQPESCRSPSQSLMDESDASRRFPCVWINGDERCTVGSPPPPSVVALEESEMPSPLVPSEALRATAAAVAERAIATAMSSSPTGNSLPVTPTTPTEGEVCPQCQKIFKRKVYLQRHMEREHWSTAKIFKCDECSYETKHQSNLSVHRRIHTGERPYNCGACGQRYTQGHLLKSHIRSKHQGNMELYNLDKKSDSNRGRKSLDMKHDIFRTTGATDKISSLVQQLEAQRKMNSMMGGPSHQYLPHFMQHSNPGMRPLMTPTMNLASSMLSNPRYYTTGAGGMLAMPPLIPGLPPPPDMHAIMPPDGASSDENKIIVELPPTPESNVTNTTSESDEDGTPQDLSTSKRPASPFILNSEETARHGSTPEKQSKNSMMFPWVEDNYVRNSTDMYKISSDIQRDHEAKFVAELKHQQEAQIAEEMKRQQLAKLNTEQDKKFSGEVRQERKEYNMQHDKMAADMHRDKIATEMALQQRDMRIVAEMQQRMEMEELNQVHSKKDYNDGCQDSCDAAKKLRSLRRNILRMLSVLTPDSSIEDSIDYNSDQVDQLLYEVIYTNMDDIEVK